MPGEETTLILGTKNNNLEDTVAYENRVNEFIKEHKTHNKRGVGRKSKFPDVEKETIRMYLKLLD